MLTAALALGAGAAVARADEQPGKNHDERPLLARSSAGPGELVLFQVPGTPQGARYALELADGRRLAAGEDTTEEPGTVDDFEMPDLGSDPLELKLVLTVEPPEQDSWKRKLSMRYTPPVPGGTAAGASPPPPAALDGPSSGAHVRSSGSPLTLAVPSGGGSLPASSGPAAITPPTERPQAKRDDGNSSNAKPTALARAARVRHLRALRELARRRAAASRRRPLNEPATALDSPAPLPPAHRPSPARNARVDLSNTSFPGVGWTVAWRFLAGAVALLMFLAVGVGGAVRHRHGSRAATLEDELRELLAEERVRV
ncbi:MAG: hypothetical protein ABR581_09330 [Thermoleophilaceae bacterium]